MPIHIDPHVTWQWNPFAIVAHNEWRLPRVAFHAVHCAVGATAGVAALVFPALPLAAVLFALLSGVACKCLWIDWHRTSGRLVRLSQFAGAVEDHTPYTIDGPHWMSDLGLGLLGALAVVDVRSWPAALVSLLGYYLLSTFNGV